MEYGMPPMPVGIPPYGIGIGIGIGIAPYVAIVNALFDVWTSVCGVPLVAATVPPES